MLFQKILRGHQKGIKFVAPGALYLRPQCLPSPHHHLFEPGAAHISFILFLRLETAIPTRVIQFSIFRSYKYSWFILKQLKNKHTSQAHQILLVIRCNASTVCVELSFFVCFFQLSCQVTTLHMSKRGLAFARALPLQEFRNPFSTELVLERGHEVDTLVLSFTVLSCFPYLFAPFKTVIWFFTHPEMQLRFGALAPRNISCTLTTGFPLAAIERSQNQESV